MLLFGMSYICLQIFQLIGISHTHFLSYNPNFYATLVKLGEMDLVIIKSRVRTRLFRFPLFTICRYNNLPVEAMGIELLHLCLPEVLVVVVRTLSHQISF